MADTSDVFAHTEGFGLESTPAAVAGDSSAPPVGKTVPSSQESTDTKLAQARLGMAGSLYQALRCKSSQAAGHALRVSLISSAWSLRMELPEDAREAIELAALLHDVGLIGVPDRVLLKPGPLDADELRVIEEARRMSVEILQPACSNPLVLEIVENLAAWYDGSRSGYCRRGRDIPQGARMIAIVEAFDSMTTDQVFRPAMSLERAAIELFNFAGTQFDPQLVHEFGKFYTGNLEKIRREVAGRWLRWMNPEIVNSCWELSRNPARLTSQQVQTPFQNRLLDNMHDAVVFIDADFRVVQWNHGAERLTGISESSVRDRHWSSMLVQMCSEKGTLVTDEECPVRCAIESGVQSLRRMTIVGRSGRRVAVDTHAIPVVAADGRQLGAVLLMHDASSETSLERRCQSLHEKATKDALTQVANRAEFDRVLELFINTHRQQQVPCSMTICDLDHFKQVNDNFGHQAGDEAIKSLATLLKSAARPGDLVARYGGEEFVILFADCDNATAARRANEIRKQLSETPLEVLRGRPITASFGVTEIQPGDTAETMLRRADRGLLMAKEKGRNTVIQLGAGSSLPEAEGRAFWQRFRPPKEFSISRDLYTPVPLSVAIEKLRGFVADHQAKISWVEEDRVKIDLDGQSRSKRRYGDRPIAFRLELKLEEQWPHGKDKESEETPQICRTHVHVTARPLRIRDRREANAEHRAREVLTSLRSYLIASEESPAPPEKSAPPARRPLLSWRAGRREPGQ